jgi:predicted secreted protein
MRKLGLIFSALALAALGCKTSPETAPPGPSAPVTSPGPGPTPPPPGPAATTASPAGSTPAPTAPAPPAGPGRTYPESTRSIQATAGERFFVALPANITVPMKWRIEPPPDPKLLDVGEEKYENQPPADCPGCAGYGGTRTFSFTAAGPGKLQLHFTLRPLTDVKGPILKEVKIDVEIK